MKPSVRLFLIQYRREISAFCAALAAILAISLLRPHPAGAVLVAQHSLVAGQLVTRQDFTELRLDRTWPDAITEMQAIDGQRITHSLNAGTPLSSSDLLTSTTAHLPTGTLAVSINADVSDGAVASIGNHVELFSADGSVISEDSVVLAKSESRNQTSFGVSAQHLPLLVSMNQQNVSALAQSRSHGDITVALRSN